MSGEGVLRYEDSVAKEGLDRIKRRGVELATGTFQSARNLINNGVTPLLETLGESCFVMDLGPMYLGTVNEVLGTKSAISLAMHLKRIKAGVYTEPRPFFNLGQCVVSAATNDLSTLGISPLAVQIRLDLGDKSFPEEHHDLLIDLEEGTAEACRQVGCGWGGGESATEADIVTPEGVLLGMSAVGILRQKHRLLASKRVVPGLRIVLLRSTGMHINGATLPRQLERQGRASYDDVLSDGQTFGDALLEPTALYSPVVDDLIQMGLQLDERTLEYAGNLSGGGLLKIMRSKNVCRYHIGHLPEPHPVFPYIQEKSGNDTRTMYATYNMGVGYVLFLKEQYVDLAIQCANRYNIGAYDAGYVDEGPSGGVSELYIEPIEETYSRTDLTMVA